ncbi:hypothetical protein [Selenomonas sp.]|uniref:hypothetical protein n=1 Tax=Selenomonas sp. TaxID=2053611 RepID=UPI003FA2DC9C
MKMKHWLAAVLPFMVLTATAGAAPYVSSNIYEWVQSSARANYFFNKRVMHYGLTEDGAIDPNVLIVPTLQTYDDVAIADVVAKRRWRGESLAGYYNLVGEAAYLRIDLAAGTSTLERADDLDSTWSTLTTTFPQRVTIIKELPEKSLERKFLEAVLVYEHGHCMEIAAQTKKVLTADDLKRLEEHERGALAAGAGAVKEKALKDDVAAAD